MMRRRALLLPLLLAGCALSERPYAERRQWPLIVARPAVLPPRAGGGVLELRNLRAGPGLGARGLQSVQPDGSIRTAFYEEWAVPPAQGAEDALRAWLAASGLYAAVVGPGSRAVADRVLEGELSALWTEPAAGRAKAALSVTLLAPRAEGTRILLQRRFEAAAPLPGADPKAAAQAMSAALAMAFADIEAALRQSGG